jgi:hypothetical protein
MIKYAFTGAAFAALALGAPAIGHAQMTQPMAQPTPNVINTNATAADQGYVNPYATPMPGAYGQPAPFGPRSVWIPGRYNWDPGSNNYVWTDGQFVEAPRENAQWLPGHWEQTPTAWIWVDGRWN